MYSDQEYILKQYSSGSPLEYIASKCGISSDEIMEILRGYKKTQFVKGKYSDELMKLVSDRDSSGAKRKDIMSELKISRSFLVRAIEEYGFLSKATDESAEEFFKEVSEDFEFTECLKCGSARFNEIQGNEVEDSPSGIYCMSCGSEFTLNDNIVNIVKWEYID